MTMRHNVIDLLRSPTGETRWVEVGDELAVPDADVRLIGPVCGGLRLIREPDGILVVGELTASVAVECARCLAPLTTAVSLELADSFLPTVAVPGGPPVRPAEAMDPATLIDETHVLDLTEVIRQAVVLAVPLVSLCRPECRGLCPHCGQDLNEGPCDCRPPADARWDALRDLLGPA